MSDPVILAGATEQLAVVRAALPRATRVRAALGLLLVEGLTELLAVTGEVPLRLLVEHEGAASLDGLALQAVTGRALEAARAREHVAPSTRAGRELRAALARRIRGDLARLELTAERRRLLRAAAERLRGRQVEVRLLARRRLATKLLLFDGAGAAIVSPANLLIPIEDPGVLALRVSAPGQLEQLGAWFEQQWAEGVDVREELARELTQCWALAEPSPAEVAWKLLAELAERGSATRQEDVLWDDEINLALTAFQRDAVLQAVRLVRRHGGCFVSDVVGLGKSFVGAAILKHLERTYDDRALILCPSPLVDMWSEYVERFGLNARVVSTGQLREGSALAPAFSLESGELRGRSVVLVDESHAFRNPNTQRYRLLEAFAAAGRKVVLLTATPLNNSPWDVYHQLKLFHRSDATALPISPPNLRDFVQRAVQGEAELPDLLGHVLIRRTRRDVLRGYGRDAETGEPIDPARAEEYVSGRRRAVIDVAGELRSFPRRTLTTVGYSIEATYQGLYERIRAAVAPREGDAAPALLYAFYDRPAFLRPERAARYPASLAARGLALAGLMRVLLFKRLESSVDAFRQTVLRMLGAHRELLERLLAHQELPARITSPEQDEGEELELAIDEQVAGWEREIPLRDLELGRFEAALRADAAVLEELLRQVGAIGPAEDAKLRRLVELLRDGVASGQQFLIFTSFAATARYLHEALAPLFPNTGVGVASGRLRNRSELAARFAPRANPLAAARARGAPIEVLIATDVLSEGLNLQDCNQIVNYDLHWNPVRLIQRLGRVDRIGSLHETICAYNFLPETGLDAHLGLTARLRARIEEIHRAIGEDSAVLEATEQLNERALYAIYAGGSEGLDELEGDDPLARSSVAEATALVTALARSDPGRLLALETLPDALQAALPCDGREGCALLLRAGEELRLQFVDRRGAPEPAAAAIEVLRRAVAWEDDERIPVPAWAGAAAEAARRQFEQELAEREGARRHQRFRGAHGRVLRRLTEYEARLNLARDRDELIVLDEVRQALRGEVPRALARHLRKLEQAEAGGPELLRALRRLCNEHGLFRASGARDHRPEVPPVRVLGSVVLARSGASGA